MCQYPCVIQFSVVWLAPIGSAGNLNMREPGPRPVQAQQNLASAALLVIEVKLQAHRGVVECHQNIERLGEARQEVPRHIHRVQGLNAQSAALGSGLIGRPGEVAEQGIGLSREAALVLSMSGHDMDTARIEHVCRLKRPGHRLTECLLLTGQGSQPPVTARPVATRRVDEGHLKSVSIEQLGQDGEALVVGEQELDRWESRTPSGSEPLERRQLWPEEAEVGSEARHDALHPSEKREGRHMQMTQLNLALERGPLPSGAHLLCLRPHRMKATHRPWISALLSIGLWIGVAGLALAKSTLPGPVLSVDQLRPLVEKQAVTVLDTRELFQTDGKTPNYAAGHIPGALPAPYSAFRGPADNPGAVTPIAKLNGLVQSLGLNPARPVVLAGSGSDPTELGGVARIYWTLKAAGFWDLAVLNGGTGAWMAAKLPLETQSPAVKQTRVQLQYDPQMLLAAAQVQSMTGQALLIDARPEEFFTGDLRHPAASRWGTLPGAKHLDSAEWFVPNTGRLLAKAQLEAIAKREGFQQNRPAVVFCNTGHWAATHWFITSEVLGYSTVKMYPESVVGWSRLGLPMDNEPSRSTVLMRQLKGEGVMG